MKRLIIAAILLSILLCACGTNKSSNNNQSNSKTESSQSATGSSGSSNPKEFHINDTAKFTDGSEVTMLGFGSFVDSGKRLCYVYLDVVAGKDVTFAVNNTYFSDKDGYKIGELYAIKPGIKPYNGETLVQRTVYAGQKAKGLVLAEMANYYKQEKIIFHYGDASFILEDPDLKDTSRMLSGIYQNPKHEDMLFTLDFMGSGNIIGTCKDNDGYHTYEGNITYTGDNKLEVLFNGKSKSVQYGEITYDMNNKSFHMESAPDSLFKIDYYLVQKGSSSYKPNNNDVKRAIGIAGEEVKPKDTTPGDYRFGNEFFDVNMYKTDLGSVIDPVNGLQVKIEYASDAHVGDATGILVSGGQDEDGWFTLDIIDSDDPPIIKVKVMDDGIQLNISYAGDSGLPKSNVFLPKIE